VTTPPTILVGISDPDRHVWVRVEGKGSFLNNTGLKEFAKEMINRGFREFRIDLQKCPVMDSTFMGTLTGISLRLRELGSGQVSVLNLNERNRDLLANLGLDQLFTMGGDDEGPASAARVEPLDGGPTDKTTRAETMLEAHYALVAANPANAAKFKDVLEYLKQDLHLAR
jgi:anti-sigma B factor antagonist